MLQNIRVTAFIVFELSGENQRGEGAVKVSPTQIKPIFCPFICCWERLELNTNLGGILGVRFEVCAGGGER